MNQNPNIISILELLKANGESPEDIAQVIQEITNAASAKLTFEMTSVLSEEDMQILNQCKDESEAEPLMRSMYAKKTSISPEALINQFLEIFTRAFIDKYNLDKLTAMATPVEPAPAPTL
jgi:hypothetical protein